MDFFIQLVVNGLSVGFIYGISAMLEFEVKQSRRSYRV